MDITEYHFTSNASIPVVEVDDHCLLRGVKSCDHDMCKHSTVALDECDLFPSMKNEPVGDQSMATTTTSRESSVEGGFVKVELTETSTMFMIALPSKLDSDIIQNRDNQLHPILIQNPIAFYFSSDSMQPHGNSPVEDSNLPLNLSNCSLSEANRDNDKDNPDQLMNALTLFPLNFLGGEPISSGAPQTPKTPRGRKGMPIPDFITVLGGDPPTYQCNYCQRKFKTKHNINNHQFCQSGKNPLKCDHCGQTFTQKGQYRLHLRTHTGDGDRQYLQSHKLLDCSSVCSQCGKGFTNVWILMTHLMVHLDHRPFKCLICGATSKIIFNLVSHIKNSHRLPKAEAEKLAKEACAKSFPEKEPIESISLWKVQYHVISNLLEESNLMPRTTRTLKSPSNSKGEFSPEKIKCDSGSTVAPGTVMGG